MEKEFYPPVEVLRIEDKHAYAARKNIEKFANDFQFRVVDMPTLIKAREASKIVKRATLLSVDTITSENYGIMDGERVYQIAHSTGTLGHYEGFMDSLEKSNRENLFMPVELMKEKEGTHIVSLDELRKNDIPNRKHYAISIIIPTNYNPIPLGTDMKEIMNMYKKGKPIIFELQNQDKGLTRDQFLMDDSIAAICGSPEHREIAAKNIFGKEEQGYFNSSHMIGRVNFEEEGKGRLLSYEGNRFGVSGRKGWGYFLAINEKEVFSDKLKTPSLEQTLKIVNNPDFNRDDMIKAISDLYQSE